MIHRKKANSTQKFERGPAARPRAPPQNQNPVLSRNQPNTSSKAAAAAAAAAPRRRSPGESRAIRRIQGIRGQPLAAHSHGNSFSGSEAAHRAAARRNPRITACARLPSGATQPPIATAKPEGTIPPSRRPQSVLRGPSEGEEATKKLLAIGSEEDKLPSPPRHEENSACGRAGAVWRATRARELANAQQPPRA
jgi:hypothetical protein